MDKRVIEVEGKRRKSTVQLRVLKKSQGKCVKTYQVIFYRKTGMKKLAMMNLFLIAASYSEASIPNLNDGERYLGRFQKVLS